MLSVKTATKLQNYFWTNYIFHDLCIDYLNKKISQRGLFSKFYYIFSDIKLSFSDLLSFIRGIENYDCPILDDYISNVYYCGGVFAMSNLKKIRAETFLLEKEIKTGNFPTIESIKNSAIFGVDPEIINFVKNSLKINGFE